MTVAAELDAYRELGVSTFLLNGYDPLEDARAYGEVISLLTGTTRS